MKIDNKTPFAVEAVPAMDHQGNPILLVVVKATFSAGAGGTASPADEQIPVAFGDVPADPDPGGSVAFESDIVPFKPRGDIVLAGKAHAPRGNPAPFVDVTLRVGTVSKSLRVFGERKWVCDGNKLTATATRPAPFLSMDLTAERAFGGVDARTGGVCRENPAGRGYFEQEVVDDPAKTFLPNIEDPRHLIRHWKDHPHPTGFGVVGKGCQPRYGFLGSYDDAWRGKRAPKPPLDFRPDFYNAAQADLQVAGYLAGDEEIELVNLTPEGRLAFRLPGVRPGVTVARADIELLGWEAPVTTEGVAMRLDTLGLLPESKRLFLVWRGSCAIRDLGALEIREVTVQT